MAATTNITLNKQTSGERVTPGLIFVLIWHGVVGLGLLFGAAQLWQVEAFFNLGTFVPRFLGVALIALAAVMFGTIPLLYRLHNGARLIGIIFNFFGFALALLLFGHLIGLYLGIDDLARGLFQNAPLLLGFPVGYGLVWLARRFAEDSTPRVRLEQIGLGVMMLALIVILWQSGLANSIGTLISSFTRVDVLAAFAALFVFLAAGTVLLRQGDRFGETILQREAWQGWLFLLPNFVNFMLFFALPLLLSFYLSFTDYAGVGNTPPNFIVFDNYARMLSLDAAIITPEQNLQDFVRPNHFEIARIALGDQALVLAARDPLFWQSLMTTFRYCVLLLILSIPTALGLALLLNAKIPGMQFFRAVYFLPSIAAVVGVALIWQWLYNPIIGYINYAITGLVTGLNSTFGTNITDPAIAWMTDENIMLLSAVIMAAWQIIGFNAVILLAGLQGVPKEVMEAATVDGANGWTRFRKILLPLIAPTTFFVTVTTLISGLQAFTEMFVLFGNSTSNARLTTVFYLYQQGFQRFQMGYASATAWVLFAVIFVITLIQFRLSSSNRAYSD
ncbi:MAG: ABC transporter permease subunit [Chloroflexi bacterium]|uniref:carbohydrate ABC transporter permease n=1 Tax=Candidatus Flexifilum breve TaxID=3140694 RepID=UPI0031359925|nr:ABC transporter permease subunit [Chloroflexota bacterium]